LKISFWKRLWNTNPSYWIHKVKLWKLKRKGQSWLQRNWRPITMLTFLILVVCDSFGFLKFRLNNKAWLLLQIGLGGYMVGRTGEKIVEKIIK
jgi:hypothetical protein